MDGLIWIIIAAMIIFIAIVILTWAFIIVTGWTGARNRWKYRKELLNQPTLGEENE